MRIPTMQDAALLIYSKHKFKNCQIDKLDNCDYKIQIIYFMMSSNLYDVLGSCLFYTKTIRLKSYKINLLNSGSVNSKSCC